MTTKGAFVLGITKQDIDDIYEIRSRIEGLAAKLAAERATDEEIAELKNTVELQEFYTLKQDADNIKNMDSTFHRLMYHMSGSTPLYDTLEPLHKRIIKYRKASISSQTRAHESMEEHKAIYEAIAAHDGELAENWSMSMCAKPKPASPEGRSNKMGLTIAQKIIKEHLLEGEMIPGTEIGLKIDQTLTQDATGTMAYLEFEAIGIPRVKTELSVAYIDHNTLQSGFENADDHRFIQSAAAKYGIRFSRPGNGICHQVHLERFGKPGKTLIGSDSHTPTGGGIGMLAMGAGGMDVAVAMGGGLYYITMPKMYKVNLTRPFAPWVSAKDVSLEILRILSVKGGVGAIIEWGGEGVKP